jgi:hypothetical protein
LWPSVVFFGSGAPSTERADGVLGIGKQANQIVLIQSVGGTEFEDSGLHELLKVRQELLRLSRRPDFSSKCLSEVQVNGLTNKRFDALFADS